MAEKKKKILIIEDDKLLVKMYEDKLNREGFSAKHAASGEEGIVELNSSSYDLVLLDVMMPKMNGFDVLKKIKDNKATKDLKVVLLTNLDDESGARKGREMGAEDYWIKSDFTPDDIVEKVSEYL